MATSEPRIIFEDNHLLAVQKPHGLPSQGDESGDPSVVDWAELYLRHEYQKTGRIYLALLHRLDRPTTGLLLLAKTSKAAARLSAQFKEREIQKTYLAIVEGVPEQETGTLTHWLRKPPGEKNVVRAYDHPVTDAKEAVLHYRLLKSAAGRSLLEIKPETGRQHQIRVQLATLRLPIVGDVKYGKTVPIKGGGICLLSWQAVVEHPTLHTPLYLQAEYPRRQPWDLFQAPDAWPRQQPVRSVELPNWPPAPSADRVANTDRQWDRPAPAERKPGTRPTGKPSPRPTGKAAGPAKASRNVPGATKSGPAARPQRPNVPKADRPNDDPANPKVLRTPQPPKLGKRPGGLPAQAPTRGKRAAALRAQGLNVAPQPESTKPKIAKSKPAKPETERFEPFKPAASKRKGARPSLGTFDDEA
jgi:23S rRNA pseudouridine1911/1915/1917 synthase